ncbi:MAG TPA: hypothetical protein VHO06_09405 [Polyangia bacterium]|nr:hypothetical protein [Polyangia bacterium]
MDAGKQSRDLLDPRSLLFRHDCDNGTPKWPVATLTVLVARGVRPREWYQSLPPHGSWEIMACVSRVPEMLVDLARALVERSAPEAWHSPDGTARVLGPMNAPFDTLYVMLLDGPDAADRIRAFLGLSGRSGLGSFVAIADLTQEVGRPALLVERIGDGVNVRRAA